MQPRRWLFLGLLTVLGVVGAVALRLLPPRPPIKRDSIWKIQKSMTRADVEAIIGGPPRDERTELVVDDIAALRHEAFNGPPDRSFMGDNPCDDEDELRWWSDTVVICVIFDKSDRVCWRSHTFLRRRTPGLIERFLNWLRGATKPQGGA